uniref:cupin domain-containing protein n=1 Tax=Roseovarius indicus TaxID=540747 RepID=UPI003B5279C2
MYEIDTETGWSEIPGTSGLAVKLLSGDFDEANARGFRTRYVRFEPGGETFEPFTHTYWEEVCLVEGALVAKEDGQSLEAPAYVIRPPGTPHGPFISPKGCLLLEIQYFAERAPGETDYLDPKAPT